MVVSIFRKGRCTGVKQFLENGIQVTVYADKNIPGVQAQYLWDNNVASIFVDDPREYF